MFRKLVYSSAASRLHSVPPQISSGNFVKASRVLRTAIVSEAETSTSEMEIERVYCLSDNYSWLLHDPQAGTTAVVDPAEKTPVQEKLKSKGWTLTHILNTHHHHDHVGANLSLKKEYEGLCIVGPAADKDRIPGIDICVADGDVYKFGSRDVHVFDTPGHTKGHITFWIPSTKALFPGDTLFALGCGRLFEGDPQVMWSSLSKLLPLPDDTKVYCAHEYTQSNARFAVFIDPSNSALAKRKEEIDDMRSQNIPTVPSLLGEEKATNPFLRPFSDSIRSHLGLGSSVPDWQVFGVVRKAKDVF
ncbi:hypothetical protein CEUSTIGMA_g4859.t1 [Chlamydomonas eustigma]|uniref:hydroxyacylglutathione hydrolase n=1 Tax=Chlamydomonas eustigma TaxID=1157962 RepID=A0A250X2U3_9CHLO|nr:hypothetical protein CEUSTIGMA_g4859.t1 [Chlamydomonas eustigma]|eukprot:GAX77413.1 hypothetical protein CEUSTIGMA_g4859.t1 [Chlamydomonas eustigma]